MGPLKIENAIFPRKSIRSHKDGLMYSYRPAKYYINHLFGSFKPDSPGSLGRYVVVFNSRVPGIDYYSLLSNPTLVQGDEGFLGQHSIDNGITL
jgi:hypothetical protein